MRAKAFQAQALDNSSSDHLRLTELGAELGGSIREKTYSEMASISANGTVLFAQDGVKLFVKGNAAVLQVVAEERDCANRLAPVVCWIEQDLEHGSDTRGVDAVCISLERFATAIGRSLSKPKWLAAREALDLFAKKRPSQGWAALPIVLLQLQRKWTAWLKKILKVLKSVGK